jgi:hypothetical protein
MDISDFNIRAFVEASKNFNFIRIPRSLLRGEGRRSRIIGELRTMYSTEQQGGGENHAPLLAAGCTDAV